MRFERPILLTSILKKAITVTPRTSLVDALGLLLQYKIKRLVVVKNANIPVGIITEKDIARASSVFNARDIGDLRVSDLMSDRLVTIKKNGSIEQCAKLMTSNNISSIVVLNEDKSLTGIVTKTDLVGAFLINGVADEEVSKFMTRKVVTVAPKELLFVVQSVLVNSKVSRVVVAKNKRPVGIITYRDFLPAKTANWMQEYYEVDDLEELRNHPRPNEFNANSLDHGLTFRAEDIMTPNPIVINKNEFLFKAALLMIRNQVSGIPVVHNKLLVGVITKSDIVRGMAES
ncbi:MAG TPA: CBS domain-containing protein [Candidatus Nitrosotalea sp.]|nr:CBS domain-containing protein [Candidatus Nitrosotalea sp.]